MTLLSETKVLSACQVLFGEGLKLDSDFLLYLQPSGAKAAYRRRAKEIHPDLLERGTPQAKRRRSELFRQLVEAQEVVNEFLRQREAGLWGAVVRSVTAPRPATASSPPAAHRPGEGFYRGPLPQIHLSIGRYCYFRGVIPYRTLIEALAWQRRQRPLLGELARRWGWLNEDALRRVTGVARGGRFGERAVQLGLLVPGQVHALLHYQRGQQQRLGRYFIDRGFASSREMDQLVADLHLHNAAVFNLGVQQSAVR